MSDLTERLRRHAKAPDLVDQVALYAEAADAIDERDATIAEAVRTLKSILPWLETGVGDIDTYLAARRFVEETTQ